MSQKVEDFARADGSPAIVGPDGEVMTKVSDVTSVNPCGSQILIELLTSKEILGTVLELPMKSEKSNPNTHDSITGAPQGYILAMGPKVPLDLGFGVGDRVTLHGNYTPIPDSDSLNKKYSHRPWILVEPFQIKAVFVERSSKSYVS